MIITLKNRSFIITKNNEIYGYINVKKGIFQRNILRKLKIYVLFMI